MTAEKQRPMVWGKLSDETLCPQGPAFLTSPCHAWILPEELPTSAPAKDTDAGPTKGGPDQ